MAGTVNSVAAIADPKTAGEIAIAAGSGSSYAAVYSGKESENVIFSPGSLNRQNSRLSLTNVPAFKITDLLGRSVAVGVAGSSGNASKLNRGERLSAGKYVSSAGPGSNGATVINIGK